MNDSLTLRKRISQISFICHTLCYQSLDKYLPTSGNIGVFCQSDDEFDTFDTLRKEITKPSSNSNQKYFELKEPITVPSKQSIPKATYTHLYIRKFDPTPYGKYLGDIDFVLSDDEYARLKAAVTKGKIKNAHMYARPGWDTVQINDPKLDAVAYVSTKEFAGKVRLRFD